MSISNNKFLPYGSVILLHNQLILAVGLIIEGSYKEALEIIENQEQALGVVARELREEIRAGKQQLSFNLHLIEGSKENGNS